MHTVKKAVAVLAVGISLLMTPLSQAVRGIGGLVALAGSILVVYRLVDTEFEDRVSLLSPLFWMLIAGVIPYGLINFPKSESAELIGSMIDNGWTIALSYGLASTAIYTGITILVLDFWSIGSFFMRSSDEWQSGPDEQ